MADDASPRTVNPTDGLANVVTGQGTERDKRSYSGWSIAGRQLSAVEIDSAYRSSWLVRKIHDVIPAEMTKNWRAWNLEGKEADAIGDEEKRLNVREVFHEALRLGALRGGAAIIMGLDGDAATPAPPTVGPRGLKYLYVTTRDHLTFNELDSDLQSEGFGLPTMFQLTAAGRTQQDVHPSRVLIFPGVPATKLSTGTLAQDVVWGLPKLEAINSAIMDAETAMGGVAAMIPEALVDIIGIPGLTSMVSTAKGEKDLAKRLQVAKLMRSQFRAVTLDSGDGTEGSGEKWETRQLSFGGLPDLIMTFLQMVAGAADMPLTRLVGAPPKGMNATGEHDEKNFLAMVKGRQDTELRRRLERMDAYLLPSAGVKDVKASFSFNPLAETTPQEQAELDNLTADTYNILATTGLIQHDALAKTLVSELNERATFPGLADNVSASTSPLPAVEMAKNATLVATAKAATPTLGASPSKPGQSAARATRRGAQKAAKDGLAALDAEAITGLRTVTVGDEVLTLRTISLDEVRDATPRSLYVSRKLLNPQEFLNHWRGQGVEDLMAAGDLHVTVMYSLIPVDWMKVPADWSRTDNGRLLIPPGGPRVVEQLGDSDVQEFNSSELQWRYDQIVEAGAVPSHREYRPHVSFRKSDELDVMKLKPYVGRFLFAPEVFEEIV
jgi:phage-related protein (TIGR01555 family)